MLHEDRIVTRRIQRRALLTGRWHCASFPPKRGTHLNGARKTERERERARAPDPPQLPGSRNSFTLCKRSLFFLFLPLLGWVLRCSTMDRCFPLARPLKSEPWSWGASPHTRTKNKYQAPCLARALRRAFPKASWWETPHGQGSDLKVQTSGQRESANSKLQGARASDTSAPQ